MDSLRIWSVGHSNHDTGTLLALLASARIEVVADIRSQPFSRYNPQFNQAPLRDALGASGLRYVFLGKELGGRPPEHHFYDGEGHVLYADVARSERFQAGLRRLMDGAAQFRVAMLCSEEEPTNCHRRLLVTRVLSEDGVKVEHIRGNGTILPEERLRELVSKAAQDALFDREDDTWRSARSVSQGTPQRTSSRA